jgi:phosphoribosylaminoimidazole-succinocarboxamide synthase
MPNVVLQTEVPGAALVARGKVRDVYDAGPDRLLFVATDRISAFDCVMPNGIPDKGRVLTRMSMFWFRLLSGVVPNHVITAEAGELPAPFGDRPELAGRSMLVRRAQIIPIECVARGYLAGSGWKEYRATGKVCGIELLEGLRECDRLPEPIFTPATKAASGHDENIGFERVVETVGEETARQLRDLTLTLYDRAGEHARTRGILLADTKFEFGWIDGRLTLADEVLTPDSSRYWPAEDYEPGRPQPSFDKQFVREYLESLDWDKTPPAPALPEEVVARTREKYIEAFERITGETW